MKNKKGCPTNEATPTQGDVTTQPAPLVGGQRALVLASLRLGPVTTFELRTLGVPSPAARVLELKAVGYNIATNYINGIANGDSAHNGIARYSLRNPEWIAPEGND